MDLSAIMTGVRYLLVFAGGFAVSKGWLDNATLETVVASIVALATAVIGIVTNVKKTEKVKAAQTVLATAETPVSNAAIAKAAAAVK